MGIVLADISKSYGSQKVISNLSLKIGKGEIVGFLGPNGAGKSTTMKMITGFIKPDAGSVSVCGVDMVASSLEAKRHIGYLPEHNPMYLDMYVREYLDFTAGVYGIADRSERVDEVICLTGLQSEYKKLIGMLSKGYRQRVGLAASIIHNPDVLILDEPTTGLDPNQIVEIRELIKDFGKNRTVMLSTHIMQEAEAVCSRYVILKKGSVVLDSMAADVKKGTLEDMFRKLTM